MAMNSLRLVILLGCLNLFTNAANILVLMPLPFTSHILAFKPLFIELANRGHNVTYVSSVALPETKNLHQTIVKEERIENIMGKFVDDIRISGAFNFLTNFWKYGIQFSELMGDHPVIRRLLEDETSKFDLLIMEPYFVQEHFLTFGHKFNVPVVGIFPLSPSVWASHYSGTPMPFSYVPTYKAPLSDTMTLKERITNTLINVFEFIGSTFYYLPQQEELMSRKYVYKGSENRPSLKDMMSNVSIHLIDYHFSSGYNRPFDNNVFQVGGLTLVRAKTEPLEKKLQELMDKSKGVIYLSFGGHVEISSLGKEKVQAIFKAFGQLSDYQVLLKWGDVDPPENLPSNVYTSRWFPQPTVLSHPKCKVMIGHGGVHGLMESMNHGVPYIGMPFFSDQEFNLRFVVSKGFGLRVGHDEITSTHMYNTLTKILEDTKFKKNAMIRAAISQDRMMSSMDLTMYGIEYVLRHKGAGHLRPAVLDLHWYQYLLLDVIAVVVVLPLVLLYVLFKLSKRLISSRK